jgi:PmbA protein
VNDPGHIARTALDRSRRLGISGGVGLELYVEFGRTTAIKVFGGKIESVSTAQPRGLGVRALDSGRVGYAYTGDLTPSGIDRALLQATENARAADVDPLAALPGPSTRYEEIGGLWLPGVSSTPIEQKAAIAMEAEAQALGQAEIELVEESEYADADSRVAILSTEGVEAEGEQSYCFAYLMAHAVRDGDRQSGLGFTLGREPTNLEPVNAGLEAAHKARVLLGAAPCPTGRYNVVLVPEVAAALLAAICGALSADAVQKGRSVFQGRVGEPVAAPEIELWDDGLAVEGLSSSPFDGEGVATQRTPLLRQGVLQSYLYDSYTARKAGSGFTSTGNAGRGSYRSLPAVASTNVILAGGEGDLGALLGRVGEGLLVESVAGFHSGINPATGEISVGVVGRLIEAGAPARPVREVTMATDFLSMLASIADRAGDDRWIPLYGSVRTPSVAVQSVAVSGT